MDEVVEIAEASGTASGELDFGVDAFEEAVGLPAVAEEGHDAVPMTLYGTHKLPEGHETGVFSHVAPVSEVAFGKCGLPHVVEVGKSLLEQVGLPNLRARLRDVGQCEVAGGVEVASTGEECVSLVGREGVRPFRGLADLFHGLVASLDHVEAVEHDVRMRQFVLAARHIRRRHVHAHELYLLRGASVRLQEFHECRHHFGTSPLGDEYGTVGIEVHELRYVPVALLVRRFVHPYPLHLRQVKSLYRAADPVVEHPPQPRRGLAHRLRSR